MNKSVKPIKNLSDFMRPKTYTFPKEAGNAYDPKTHKRCIYLSVNFDSIYLPVDEPLELEEKYWQLLKDIGIIQKYSDNSFDPIRNVQ